MNDKKVTATLLRRQLHDALKSAETNTGRTLITRHGKVVAALVSAADLEAIQRMPKKAQTLSEPSNEYKLEAVATITPPVEIVPVPLPGDELKAEVKATKLILDL